MKKKQMFRFGMGRSDRAVSIERNFQLSALQFYGILNVVENEL